MKKLITLIISISMVLAAVPVSADTQQVTGGSSLGEMDKNTGEFKYHDPEMTVPKNIGAEKLPEKYDLRNEGRSTDVKNQIPHGVCWTFATMASLESNLITKGLGDSKIDLSEAHLAYYFNNGASNATISKFCGRDSGSGNEEAANYFNATATLARGYGAVAEKDFPYSAFQGEETEKKYISSKLMTKSTYGLTDAIIVNGDPTEKDYDKPAVDAVKKLIKENGAVATRMDFPNGNEYLLKEFGSTHEKDLKAFYEKEEDIVQGGGHAVTIIGWDDNYNDFPSANVKEIEIYDKKAGKTITVPGNKPAGPGAWIIKDSYGTSFHGGGYFYMSYYSANLFQYVSFKAEKSSKKEMYQYDGIGVGENILMYKKKISGANTYTARTDLLLNQLASYSPCAGSKTNFKVYVNQNGKSPVSGSKVYNKTFKRDHSGYNVLNMGKTVAIPKGTKFSIVVTTTSGKGEYYAPFEVTDAEQSGLSPAAVRPGQSYFLKSGKWNSVTYKTKFYDTSDGSNDPFRVYNALAKGFGKKGGTKAQKIKVKTKRTMKKGRKLKLKAKVTKGKGRLYYQVSNTRKATVSAKGVVKAKKKGTIKVTIYAAPTSKYKSARKVVKVKIR